MHKINEHAMRVASARAGKQLCKLGTHAPIDTPPRPGSADARAVRQGIFTYAVPPPATAAPASTGQAASASFAVSVGGQPRGTAPTAQTVDAPCRMRSTDASRASTRGLVC